MTRRLLIDLGNSRLKWAAVDGQQMGAVQAIEHGGDPLSAVAQIPDAAAQGVRAIWLANVTGREHTTQLHCVAAQRWEVPLEAAAVIQGAAGLQVAYAQPERLGVDRWLMMLALWIEENAAFVVASGGTALTFDAVDQSGRHQGGVIAPGLYALQRAVLGTTRFDAKGPGEAYAEGLGEDTDACVRQGALHAGAGMLERLANRYPDGSGSQIPSRRVLTGGDAAILSRHLYGLWSVRPNLVLEGLLALAGLQP